MKKHLIGLCAPKQSGKTTAASAIEQEAGEIHVRSFAAPLKRMACRMFSIPMEDTFTEGGKNNHICGTTYNGVDRFKRSTTDRYVEDLTGIPWEQFQEEYDGPLHPMAEKLGLTHASEFLPLFHRAMCKVFRYVPGTVRCALQLVGTELMRNEFYEDFWVDRLLTEIEAIPSGIVVIDDCRFPNEANRIRAAGGQVIGIRREAVWDTGDRHASEQLMRDHWDTMVDVTITNDADEPAFRRAVCQVLKRRGILE